MNAIVTFVGLAVVLIGGWALGHLVGAGGRGMDPVSFFAEPYSWFPYAALAIIVAAVAYAIHLVRKDPTLGQRVGSIVADE
jgi:Na+/H+ antiporter NhaC